MEIKFISPWTKIRIFNSSVRSALIYGRETWRLTKKIIAQLQIVINRRPRYIIGVWWPRKISIEELWQRIRQERIEIAIEIIGHTLRKPATGINRLSLEWKPYEDCQRIPMMSKDCRRSPEALRRLSNIFGSFANISEIFEGIELPNSLHKETMWRRPWILCFQVYY